MVICDASGCAESAIALPIPPAAVPVVDAVQEASVGKQSSPSLGLDCFHLIFLHRKVDLENVVLATQTQRNQNQTPFTASKRMKKLD